MGVPNLPWNCPNPNCQEPHNRTSIPVDGKIVCHSCGWEREAPPAPESLDDFEGLFEPPDDDSGSGP